MNNKLQLSALAVAGTLVFSACGGDLPNQRVGQVSVARGQAMLMVMPQVVAGGYKAQALINNYKRSDINHLVIKVFELQGNTELPVVDEAGNQVQVDLLNSELDAPVKFSNLFRNTTYRIRCYAYTSPGEQPADLISTTDASSYTDVFIANDDTPAVTQLRVRLVDVVFNGEFTSGVNVVEGGIVRGGTVTVTKQTNPPTLSIDNIQSLANNTYNLTFTANNIDMTSKISGFTPNRIIVFNTAFGGSVFAERMIPTMESNTFTETKNIPSSNDGSMLVLRAVHLDVDSSSPTFGTYLAIGEPQATATIRIP